MDVVGNLKRARLRLDFFHWRPFAFGVHRGEVKIFLGVVQMGDVPTIEAPPVEFAIGVVSSNLHKYSNRSVLDLSAGVVALKVDEN